MLSVVLMYVAIVVGSFFMGGLFSKALVRISLLDMNTFAFLATVFFVCSFIVVRPRHTLEFIRGSRFRFDLVVVGFLVIFIPLTIAQIIAISGTADLDFTFTRMLVHFPLLLLVIGVSTLAEEYIFRGIFRRYGPKGTVLRLIWCTVPWLVIHLGTPQSSSLMFWVNLTAMGLLFWWTSEITQGIELPWGLHLGNNLAVISFYTATNAEVTAAITSPTIKYACLFIYVIGWVLVGLYCHKEKDNETNVLDRTDCCTSGANSSVRGG